MCGIAGVVAIGQPEATGEAARLARLMLARLVHRGPDDEGLEAEAGVALAARRLSIIDLEGGHQPLLNETGRIVACQNGELYTYAALASDLRAAGHRFRTRCDTEVLVHGYEAWGPDGLLSRLRGMFAFALHDRDRERLVLGRDRFGEKPLFYARAGRRFLFASELTALLASGLVPFRVEPRARECLLGVHFVPGDLSAVAGVSKLPPGHWLELDTRTGRLEVREYWDLDLRPDEGLHEAEIEARVRDGVAVAVRRCLVADVPVGLFLSGGLDSSILAAEVAAQGADLATFSIGFDDPNLDESVHARDVASSFGARHREVRFRVAEAIAALTEAPRFLDEPVGDPAALTVHLLARVAREAGVKVVLSGEGADEIFGGYDYYWQRGPFAPRGPRALARWARDAVRGLLATGQEIESPVLTPDPGATLSGFPIVANPGERRQLLGEAAAEPSPWERRIAARARAIGDPVRRRRYVDLKTWLPDDLLVKLDRMTMACSVEGRAPYLDTDLAALAFALPTACLRHRGMTKAALRRAFAQSLPATIASRQKQGFVLPLSAWIAGPLRDEFADTLGSRQDDGVDERVAISLLGEHAEGRADRARLLYALFVYRRWFARVRHEAAAAAWASVGGMA